MNNAVRVMLWVGFGLALASVVCYGGFGWRWWSATEDDPGRLVILVLIHVIWLAAAPLYEGNR